MNELYDVLLARPLPFDLIRFLLFIVFALHLLFVLFMLGTAILSVVYYLYSQFHPDHKTGKWAWAEDIHHTFIAHKSLAVVIGVAALLLIQVGFTQPFLTAVNLFASDWLMVIIFLILSFLGLELLGLNWGRQRILRLTLGLVGLVLLLSVAAVFVTVLVTMEYPQAWVQIVHNGYRLPGWLVPHWTVRYLHVLGASVVFGAAFHYFFSKREQTEKKAVMKKWLFWGLAYQAGMGMLLVLSQLERLDWVSGIFIVIGAFAAFYLLASLIDRTSLPLRPTALLLLMILLPMLLGRQALQDRVVLPMNESAEKVAANYQRELAPYTQSGLDRYTALLETKLDRGETIYPRSCAFCHGEAGDGTGVESANLKVPPERLSEIRSNPAYLHRHIVAGINGTGMPYFKVYTKDKLDSLLTHLDQQFGIYAPPEKMNVSIPDAAYQEARGLFYGNCANCHGGDARGSTTQSANYAPPPPDLTQYTLTPAYAFEVISKGYPGTMMPAFSQYSEEVRWGLVKVVHEFYAQ